MDGQLEGQIALDDIYIAVQRIRDVVSDAETYRPQAMRESLKPLLQDMAEARVRLEKALRLLEEACIKAYSDRN